VRLTRPRRIRSPSLSGSSGDEDATGTVKPGKKRYCLSGLYWVKPEGSTAIESIPMQLDDSPAPESRAESVQPETALEAVPLAIPENAQPQTTRLSKRASAVAASSKLARNGRGSLPGQLRVSNTVAAPMLQVRSRQAVTKVMLKRPDTSLFPETIHQHSQTIMDVKRSFRLPASMIKDYNPVGVRLVLFKWTSPNCLKERPLEPNPTCQCLARTTSLSVVTTK
jgi:hypothetical protein